MSSTSFKLEYWLCRIGAGGCSWLKCGVADTSVDVGVQVIQLPGQGALVGSERW